MKKWMLEKYYEFKYLDWLSKMALVIATFCFVYFAALFLSGCGAGPSWTALKRLEENTESKIRYCSTVAANYDLFHRWCLCTDCPNKEAACNTLVGFRLECFTTLEGVDNQ